MQGLLQSPNAPNDVNKLINELPEAVFMDAVQLRKWEGFWFSPEILKSAIIFRSNFQARDDDVFLASTVKTGTTWLKALSLCIMQNRQVLEDSHDILTTENPHFHIPTIEAISYSAKPPPFDPYDASNPRLLHTHLPYSVLPDSVKNSKCKIVYIARNPKDTVISMWHFFNSVFRPDQEPYPLEKTVDCLYTGIHHYGSFFDHVVEYWEESKKRPQKVLFIKYEELRSNPEKHVSRIAEFLERPFGDEGEVDQVVSRCSLERLKNLEVNKNGAVFLNAPNNIFFRKGEVGDWKNYFTSEMELRVNEICRTKLHPFGLFF